VAERRARRLGLRDQAVVDQLEQAALGGQLGDDVDVERLAGDRRCLGGAARVRRQRRRPHEHGVAYGRGNGQRAVLGQLDAVRAGPQKVSGAQRGGQLLDEERDALRAVVDHARERRGDRLAQDARGQVRRPGWVERLQRQLVQAAGAAELRAQPPQRVPARQLVGPVRADHEQRQLSQRVGERGQHLEGRVVGPVQVVDHDDGGRARRDRRERAAERLDQRRLVAAGRGLADLGQHHGQVPAQRAAARQAVGRAAQVRAQRGDQRGVRLGARLAGGAAQYGESRLGRRDVGQPRLPDAGLTAQQHDAARTLAGAVNGRAEPLALAVAPDQRWSRHGAMLSRLTRQREQPAAHARCLLRPSACHGRRPAQHARRGVDRTLAGQAQPRRTAAPAARAEVELGRRYSIDRGHEAVDAQAQAAAPPEVDGHPADDPSARAGGHRRP
jgi:hypothetical protein